MYSQLTHSIFHVFGHHDLCETFDLMISEESLNLLEMKEIVMRSGEPIIYVVTIY